jgi:hypothetical protein
VAHRPYFEEPWQGFSYRLSDKTEPVCLAKKPIRSSPSGHASRLTPRPRRSISGTLCVLATFAAAIPPASRSPGSIRWRKSNGKDWHIIRKGLEPVEARTNGSGGSIELPEARLSWGWFHWKPARPLMVELTLGNSGSAVEWRLCAGGKCRTLSEFLGHPIGIEVATKRVCKQ